MTKTYSPFNGGEFNGFALLMGSKWIESLKKAPKLNKPKVATLHWG